MRTIIFLTLLLGYSSLFAQDKIVTGRVFDENGVILNGVSVCQGSSFNCYFTDYLGIFHLLVDNKIDNSIVIKENGFKPFIINHIDTITTSLHIVLEKDENFNELDQLNFEANGEKYRRGDFHMFLSLELAILELDYSEFENQLGDYNIELLERIDAIPVFELGFRFKRIYTGVEFGITYYEELDFDSLSMEITKTRWGLNLGYNLIDSRRFTVTPNFALKANRSRLINSAKDNKIELQEYIEDRNLDIRINQLTGFAGLDLSYKMCLKNNIFSNYSSIGIFGGYAFKINKHPWIYSLRSRLKTNRKLGISDYEFGFYFRLNY